MRPHRLPKYVQAWVDKEGRPHHYFRRPGYKRVPLPGLPWSPKFMAAYEAATKAEAPPIGAKRVLPGSVGAAVALFYTSLEFRSLAPGSQAMRRAILERFREQYGTYPMATLPQKFILVVLAKMKPFAARNWLKSIRALCQFCVTQELCAIDVTQGIRLPKVKTNGHHTWTEDEIAKYEAAHAVGTKARLALALPLFTAQRRGDVIRMGKQHLRDGMDAGGRPIKVLSFRQQKTGHALAIPVHHALQAIIDATPSEHLTFLTTRTGKPYAGNGFTEQFAVWRKEAGLPARCKVHGLRKAAARRLAEVGCSVNEIAAFGGWTSLSMVEKYTKAASQEVMAINALARTTANEVRTESVKAR